MGAGDRTKTGRVNNDIYHQLGERWYTARDDPIALLRAEARSRNPWVAENIRHAFPTGEVRVLDIGCGGGFLSNYLAGAGFTVTGLDAAAESLAIARRHDATGRVCYVMGDAYRLPYADGAFQAACAMDFLEHVDEPGLVVAEAARILQPGGLFFFATFNRNFISWLFGIKGVEWFVKNTPPRLHELSHFIKPAELRAMCEDSGLRVNELRGFAPRFNRAFWRLLVTGVVTDDFTFQFGRNTLTGYIGIALKSTDC
jgi:2-polyprenyl-6-hydroxyphenyl methylase / 3-demethylubiquinone-9 3-methyltransferase